MNSKNFFKATVLAVLITSVKVHSQNEPIPSDAEPKSPAVQIAEPVVNQALLDQVQGLKRPCANGGKYQVALTFDDGPSVHTTPKVLDVLAKFNIKATFFVVGELLDPKSKHFDPRHLDLIKRMKNEGHLIGSHTYTHRSHTCGPEKFQSESQAQNNLRLGVEATQNFNTDVFRFPFGDGWLPNKCPSMTRPIMTYAHSLGKTHVGWDVDTSDYSKIARKALPGSILGSKSQSNRNTICSTKGGVILMHDVHANTANNLEYWMASIHHSGHSFTDITKFKSYYSYKQFLDGGPNPSLNKKPLSNMSGQQ